MTERLTEEERAQLRERLAKLLDERNKLAAEAQDIADQLDADAAAAWEKPGDVYQFRPRPGEPMDPDLGGPCDPGSL